MLALLVTRWMRGTSLRELIDDRIKHLKKSGGTAHIPNVIRSVMEDVEKIARFAAPKAIACYSDVLRHFLTQRNREDLIPSIPDVSVLLELGVSQKTQVSMIGLGLSRTAAIALSELIAANSLTEDDVLDWLRDNRSIWQNSNLPTLVLKEIANVFNKKVGLETTEP